MKCFLRYKLTLKTKFFHNAKTKQFAKEGVQKYHYDESGMLLSLESGTGAMIEKKEYIYQFDTNGNWINEIITPDNTYKTRKISYYGEVKK